MLQQVEPHQGGKLEQGCLEAGAALEEPLHAVGEDPQQGGRGTGEQRQGKAERTDGARERTARLEAQGEGAARQAEEGGGAEVLAGAGRRRHAREGSLCIAHCPHPPSSYHMACSLKKRA